MLLGFIGVADQFILGICCDQALGRVSDDLVSRNCVFPILREYKLRFNSVFSRSRARFDLKLAQSRMQIMGITLYLDNNMLYKLR